MVGENESFELQTTSSALKSSRIDEQEMKDVSRLCFALLSTRSERLEVTALSN